MRTGRTPSVLSCPALPCSVVCGTVCDVWRRHVHHSAATGLAFGLLLIPLIDCGLRANFTLKCCTLCSPAFQLAYWS